MHLQNGSIILPQQLSFEFGSFFCCKTIEQFGHYHQNSRKLFFGFVFKSPIEVFFFSEKINFSIITYFQKTQYSIPIGSKILCYEFTEIVDFYYNAVRTLLSMKFGSGLKFA